MTYLGKTRRFILLLMISLEMGGLVNAQTFNSNWQLGLGIGYTNYYGDVSNYRIKGLNNIFKFVDYNKYYVNQPSFSVLLHKKLTPTLGFMIQANHVQFGMSDRYRNKNGSFDTEAVNYARSLNFRTNLQDMGIAFTFSPNNGWIGKEDVFFYPSFYLGVGVSKFDVRGDLYDENGNQYNYLLPGNISDGDYESRLRDKLTETDTRYRKVEPYVDLGVALNFRINEFLTIALQSDIKYSASDYLDDVSGKYKKSYATPADQYAAKPGYNVVDPLTLKRGDDNSRNDFYINNRVVLNIGLPKKKIQKAFTPPVIYSLAMPYFQQHRADSAKKISMQSQDSLLRVKTDSLRNLVRDSMFADSLFRTASVQDDSKVQKQLQSINAELQDIKYLLRDQQYAPRQRQLEFQADSVRVLKNKILLQRSISREDNLRMRIFDLQLDSLRNEWENLQSGGLFPATFKDSSVRYPSGNLNNIPEVFQKKNLPSVSYAQRYYVPSKQDTVGTIDPETWDNEITALKKENRYKTDPGYKATVDSLQLKLKARRISAEKMPVKTDGQELLYVEPAGVPPNNAYLESIDLLERKLVELERKTGRDSGLLINDVKSDPDISDTVAYYHEIAKWQKRERQLKDDSIASLQRQLKRSNDSAAYYRNVLLAPGLTSEPETSKKNNKWYQKLFSSRKKKNVSIIPVDTTTSKQYSQRQQYYSNQANSTKSRIEQMQRDSTLTINTLKKNIYDAQATQLKTILQKNTDSIALMQQQIQRLNDSAAYYKKALLAEIQNNDANAKASQKWYQDVFASKKKLEERTAAINTTRDNYMEQQQYYDDEASRTRRRMNEIELRNSELNQEYQTINTFRNRRSPGSYIQPSTPVVVYDQGNGKGNYIENNEIVSLRNELERLRSQFYENDQRNAGVDRSLAAAQKSNIDTIKQTISDSSQVNLLRSELNIIRNQLDSLRNSRQPVLADKNINKGDKFDPASFPVISVYFKTGAVTLPGDEISKLTPFAQIAGKNTDARIVLKGFADPVGNPVTNKTIADKRTSYVRNFLISRFGIATNRIMVDEPSVSRSDTNKKPNPLDRRVDCKFE